MGCRKPFTASGSDKKLGFEETVQRNMDSLERGEVEGCEAKVPEGWSAAYSSCKEMDLEPRWYSGKGEKPEPSRNSISAESKSLESGH